MKLYFMGICGTAMGNVALMLRHRGHEVVGADTGIYPPMSHILADAGIDVLEGYAPERLQQLQPDRVVVGNVISRGNAEIEWLLETRAFPYVSLPALLNELLLAQRNAIVITGTHGKTTTTTIAAYLLSNNSCNPGYLIGGVPVDLPSGAHSGNAGGAFVIEGDEYDSAFFDKRSKFIHYAPHVLAINNLEFDHADIFRDLQDISRSFNHLLRLVPRHGAIVINGDDEHIAQLDPAPWTQTLRVGLQADNDVRIRDFVEHPHGSSFDVLWRNQLWAHVAWPLSGLYNAQNAAIAALAAGLAVHREDPTQLDLSCLAQFNGVRRRQDKLWSSAGLEVFEDFGHHPTAIEKTLQSLRQRFPGYQLTACFEPRSNTARTQVFQHKFTQALSVADQALIGPVARVEQLAPANRLDTTAMATELGHQGVDAAAYPTHAALLEALRTRVPLSSSSGKHVVCFFSNGAFGGIMQQYVGRTEVVRQA